MTATSTLRFSVALVLTRLVVKPLKVMLAPLYDAIEGAVEYVVAHKFGLLTGPMDWNVAKEIDRAMLIAERQAMFTADGVTWTGEKQVRTLKITFPCWSPETAESAFLKLAVALNLDTR